MKLNERQAGWLAYLLKEIRDDWNRDALKTMLLEREVPSLGAVMIAATSKALDPTCRTPEPIFRTGPHWPTEHRDQLPRGPRCRTHPTFYQPCPSCAGDRKAEPQPDPYNDLPADPRWLKETT